MRGSALNVNVDALTVWNLLCDVTLQSSERGDLFPCSFAEGCLCRRLQLDTKPTDSLIKLPAGPDLVI